MIKRTSFHIVLATYPKEGAKKGTSFGKVGSPIYLCARVHVHVGLHVGLHVQGYITFQSHEYPPTNKIFTT